MNKAVKQIGIDIYTDKLGHELKEEIESILKAKGFYIVGILNTETWTKKQYEKETGVKIDD